MPARNDQAIVLRLSEFSETSQVAVLFSAGCGRLSLIAKGARRSSAQRFAPGLDLLEYGEVGYLPARQAPHLGTLTEWVQRDSFAGLRRGLPRLYGGLYAAELVWRLTEEEDPHPGLFQALLGTLTALAGDGEPTRALAAFQAELLTELGYAPNFEQCVRCGRARVGGAVAYFSSTAGGLICRDCERDCSEKCRLPAGLADTRPDSGPPRAWLALQNYHLTHLAGRPFQTAGPLAGALGLPRRRYGSRARRS